MKLTDADPLYHTYRDYVKTLHGEELKTSSFRSHPRWVDMLEHVSPSQGCEYLNLMHSEFKDYIGDLNGMISLNDSIGGPTKHGMGSYYCSPTNLRYIYQSFLLLDHAIKLGLSSIDLVEIGGGCGGLCFYIHKIAPRFNVTVNSYSLFDLEDISSLQRKCLTELGVDSVSYNPDPQSLKEKSILVSNYAFSELSSELRSRYYEAVIKPFCSHGFICWNYPHRNKDDLEMLIDQKNASHEPEKPITGPGNLFVKF